MNNCKLSVSLLNSNFFEIKNSIKLLNKLKNVLIHFDVMDGVFVPNLTFGPKFISDIKKSSKLVFDTHLMIVNPIKYVKEFANAGSDYITFHLEATENVLETIEEIKKYGVKVGISIKPNTNVCELEKYLSMVDLILVMSVEPGFGGQKFIENSINKIEELKSIREKNGYNYLISCDGGISLNNIEQLKKCGLDIGIAGTAFFKYNNKKKFVKEFIK